MNRYDVIIGKVILMNKEYPILRCEILTDDRAVAEYIMKMMGHDSEDVEFQQTNVRPHYLKYQLN